MASGKISLDQRKANLSECEACRRLVQEKLQLQRSLRTEDVEQVEEMHALFHAVMGLSSFSISAAKLPADAVKALTCPPWSADKNAFIFQTMFMRIIDDGLPENNKMDPSSSIPDWIFSIVDYVVEDAVQARKKFHALPGGHSNDENMRPWMINLVLGIMKLFAGQDEVVCQDRGTCYYEKEVNEKGEVVYKICSPIQEQTGYDKSSGKRWKGGTVVYTKIRMFVDGSWIEDYIPSKYIEMTDKGDENDMWQAVLTACNFQMQRLTSNKPISRMYVEVWTGKDWKYAVVDVFGFIQLKNGEIDKEAYKAFTLRQARIQGMMGDQFPKLQYSMFSLQSQEDFQAHYKCMAQNFHLTFSSDLPKQLPKRLFPVGTVYIDETPRKLPVVADACTDVEAALWVKGEIASIFGHKSIESPELFIKGKSLNEAELRLATREFIYNTRPPVNPPMDDPLSRFVLLNQIKGEEIAALRCELENEKRKRELSERAFSRLIKRKKRITD